MKSIAAAFFAGALMLLCGEARAETGTIVMGVNAHDSWGVAAYDLGQAEARFSLLKANNITSYRIDVEPNQRGIATLTRLVPLAKKYGIQLRPMLYVDSTDVNSYYNIAVKFAPDIQIWELGNELNLQGISNFSANIKKMILARRGIDMASAASGRKLETTLNVGAALYGVGLNNSKDSYPFIDLAIQMGLKFDNLSLHYYPAAGDRRGGWYKTYLNPLRKYRKPVFVNETHCSNIYQGDDGNSEACAAIISDLIVEMNTNFSDLVQEINMYELFDNAAAAPGAERHFGLMFSASRAKRSFNAVSLGARSSRTAQKSYLRWVNNREARTDQDVLTGMYATTWGRMDVAETFVSNLAGQINLGGASRRSILVELLRSDTVAGRMNAMDNESFLSFLFQAVLGRQIDGAALAYYAPRLSSKALTRQQFLNAILASPEAATYLKK